MGKDNTASSSSLESALSAWRAQVERDLKGADFNKRLVTRTPEGIALQPLYTRADLPADCDAGETPGQAPYRRGWRMDRTCRRFQTLRRPDAKSFNAALRDALMNGQDAVVIPPVSAAETDDWSPRGAEDLATALAGVDLSAVPVQVPVGADPLPAAALLLAHAKKSGVPSEKLSGGIAADPIASMAREGQRPDDESAIWDNLAGWTQWCAEHAPRLRTLGVDATVWHEAGAHAAQELGFALATLTETLREMAARDLPESARWSQVLVTFGVGPKFFTELAKFRAWRVLVTKWLVATEANPAAARELAVNARLGAWSKTQLDAHVNMLRSTTESLSALLGGVDGLQIPPFDEPRGEQSTVGDRIARNLHAVLQDEFGVMQPQDAGGGSWYVENLTDELARRAWEVFRAVEGRGGMRAALASGWVQEQIGEVTAQRDRNYALRRAGLVGSNLFPNLKDELPEPVSAVDALTGTSLSTVGVRVWPDCLAGAVSAISDGVAAGEAAPRAASPVSCTEFAPVECYRAAAPFEDLRRRAAAVAAERERPLQALLLKMGPVRQHKPRADFSAGFVSVGGFTPLTKESFASASDAAIAAIEQQPDVAVICSTDDTYPELVPEIARAIKAARPEISVVLAGLPREEALIQSFRDAGVDEFIHVRADVPALLGRLLSRLEAK